jgi:hypothetical protein
MRKENELIFTGRNMHRARDGTPVMSHICCESQAGSKTENNAIFESCKLACPKS